MNKVSKPLSNNNRVMLQYLNQVQKAVNALNEMGLTVINVHFEKIRPTIRVQANRVTEQLEREQLAYVYRVGSDLGRYREAQYTVECIRVIWRTYLN